MNIFLIRHGQTQGNMQGRYVGRTNEPLLQESIKQLKNMTVPLVSYVFTSNLLRCIQTAQCIYPNVPSIAVDGLQEIDFGRYEYKNYRDLNGDKQYQRFIDSGGLEPFPDEETLRSFRVQCVQAFGSCMAEARIKNFSAVAFVIHGGTIMAILETFGYPKKNYYDWQVKNGSGYKASAVWQNTGGVCQLQLHEIQAMGAPQREDGYGG
ncbi:histidine phosphatase family protein [Lachnospiraceae bacterium ZAX-1]